MGWYGNANGVRFFEEEIAGNMLTYDDGTKWQVLGHYRFCQETTTTVRVLVHYGMYVHAGSMDGLSVSWEFSKTGTDYTVNGETDWSRIQSGSFSNMWGTGTWHMNAGGATAIPDSAGGLYNDLGVFNRGSQLLMYGNIWYYYANVKYQSWFKQFITIPTITTRASICQENGMVIYPTANNPRLVKKIYVYK